MGKEKIIIIAASLFVAASLNKRAGSKTGDRVAWYIPQNFISAKLAKLEKSKNTWGYHDGDRPEFGVSPEKHNISLGGFNKKEVRLLDEAYPLYKSAQLLLIYNQDYNDGYKIYFDGPNLIVKNNSNGKEIMLEPQHLMTQDANYMVDHYYHPVIGSILAKQNGKDGFLTMYHHNGAPRVHFYLQKILDCNLEENKEKCEKAIGGSCAALGPEACKKAKEDFKSQQIVSEGEGNTVVGLHSLEEINSDPENTKYEELSKNPEEFIKFGLPPRYHQNEKLNEVTSDYNKYYDHIKNTHSVSFFKDDKKHTNSGYKLWVHEGKLYAQLFDKNRPNELNVSPASHPFALPLVDTVEDPEKTHIISSFELNVKYDKKKLVHVIQNKKNNNITVFY
jgi:hypothetical protein